MGLEGVREQQMRMMVAKAVVFVTDDFDDDDFLPVSGLKWSE
jgi:hypothetical protein